MSRHYCRRERDNPYTENLGIQAIAQDYCAKMGFPPIQPTPYVQVNKTVAKKLADLFQSTPDQSDDPEVRKCYQAMVDEVNQQWKILPVNVEPFGDDFVPYKDSPAMMDDIINNGHLWVYDGGEDHALLTRKENFKFRACHDVFGHASFGFAFGRATVRGSEGDLGSVEVLHDSRASARVPRLPRIFPAGRGGESEETTIMDFTNARAVLLLHKKWGRRENLRIGIMRKDAVGLCTHHKGDVVLYRKYDDNPKQCTVEKPMYGQMLRDVTANGFGITTINTMVCVPTEYVLDAHEKVKLKGKRVCQK